MWCWLHLALFKLQCTYLSHIISLESGILQTGNAYVIYGVGYSFYATSTVVVVSISRSLYATLFSYTFLSGIVMI